MARVKIIIHQPTQKEDESLCGLNLEKMQGGHMWTLSFKETLDKLEKNKAFSAVKCTECEKILSTQN